MADDLFYSRSKNPSRRAERSGARSPTGTCTDCELLNSIKEHGIEVAMLMDGELVIGKRCPNETAARYVVEVWRQDTTRGIE